MPISKAPRGEWPPVTDLEAGEVVTDGIECQKIFDEKRNLLRKGAVEGEGS